MVTLPPEKGKFIEILENIVVVRNGKLVKCINLLD
jgi:hypothetical protein